MDSDPMSPELKDAIRAAGGIVHADGNVFFTNSEQFLLAANASAPAQHPDDEAVDRFAARMKWKLAQARDRGRSGWQDPAWTPEQISQALRDHAEKGDPTDVANYCMFLAARNEPIARAAPKDERTPLTLREIAEATSKQAHVRSDYVIEIARAIEAAHGITERSDHD